MPPTDPRTVPLRPADDILAEAYAWLSQYLDEREAAKDDEACAELHDICADVATLRYHLAQASIYLKDVL